MTNLGYEFRPRNIKSFAPLFIRNIKLLSKKSIILILFDSLISFLIIFCVNYAKASGVGWWCFYFFLIYISEAVCDFSHIDYNLRKNYIEQVQVTGLSTKLYNMISLFVSIIPFLLCSLLSCLIFYLLGRGNNITMGGFIILVCLQSLARADVMLVSILDKDRAIKKYIK